MPNLHFVDEAGRIKTIANIDSPSFTGEPCTVSNEEHADRDIVNVEDALRFINEKINEFNKTRLVFSTNGKLENLIKGRKYMVTIYGKFNPGTENDSYTVNPVAIVNSRGNILKTSGISAKNLVSPKCFINQDATLILDSAPSDGIVYGYINYDVETNSGIEPVYMAALRLS